MKILQNIGVAGMLLFGMCACNEDEINTTPAVSFKETAISVAENAKELKVPLVLTGSLQKTGWVYVAIVDGSEKGGERGINYNIPAYIGLGEDAVRGNYTLTIIDDEYPNDDRTFVIAIKDVTGGAMKGTNNQTCTITIVDDDSKKFVSVGFDSTHMDVNEDISVVEIPVSVKGLLSDSLFFDVEVENGTAVAGVDFELLESRIKVMERESWGAVQIRIKDGEAQKEDRTFKVKITGVEGANEQDTTVAIRTNAAVCEVTIKNVVRELRFAETDVNVVEGMKPFEFPIILTAPITQDVSFTIAVKEGGTAKEDEHFTIEQKEFVIKRGETVANALITIPNDRIGRPTRYCEFEITSLTEGVNLSETARVARLTIEDDDSSIGFGTPVYGVFSYQTGRIPIILSGVKGSRVLVNIAGKPDSRIQENVHYMIMNKALEIAEGDSVAYIQVATLCPTGFEEFNFEIEITSVKGLSLGANVVLENAAKDCNMNVVKAQEINRSNWEVAYFSTQEAVNDGPAVATNILDNDENTFWHTQWSGEGSFPKGPHTIIVDMNEKTLVEEARIVYRNPDTKAVTAFFSDDQLSWASAGRTENPGTRIGIIKAPAGIQGRYMKLWIEGREADGVASIKEVYVRGKALDE